MMETIIARETSFFNPLPTELDQELNDLSREKIHCFSQSENETWLGHFNNYENDQTVLWPYQNEFVYNFGASFILPCYDETLVTLITHWRLHQQAVDIDTIVARIDFLGGHILHWV